MLLKDFLGTFQSENNRTGFLITMKKRHRQKGKHYKEETHQMSGDSVWIWGIHPVLAALANGKRICSRLLATKEIMDNHENDFYRSGLQPEIVARQEIETMLPLGVLHQGIAMLVEPLPDLVFEDISALAEGCEVAVVLILDQVTDPHNVGAILRSAAAFGALAVIMQDRNSPRESGVIAKSASGALEVIPLLRAVNLARTIGDLKGIGFWIVGLDGNAEKTLAAAGLQGRIAIVVGNEGEGMRRLTRECCDYLVRLPQTGLVESLNVSNAAAVALYELVRGDATP